MSAYVGTRRAPIGAVEPGAGSLRDQLRIVAGARDFRLLLTTFVVQALATGCMLAGVDYLASDVLGQKGAGTILFVCFVAPALLLTPAWSAYGSRFGKKQGYLVSSVILATGALLVVSARTAPSIVVFLATALVGVGYAGAQVFPLAMLPDAAAVDARRTGSGRVGVYTGVWTAGETLGLALGPGLFAVVLAIGGYRSSTDGDVAQPDSALTAITLGFSVLPAALILLSLVWLVRYSLTSAEVEVDVESRGGHHMTDALERLRALQADDLPVHGGRTLAYVYDSGLPDIDRIGREAVAAAAATNGLDPTAFPSLLRMENDLVGFGLRLLDAPDTGVGTVTSGGTESVLLAVQTARDARPEVERPAMVLPSTRHAAFDKAAHYFGVEKRVVPVGADFRADVDATAAAIRELGDRVVLVVVSAPSYAHGVIDPVPELAALAAARGIRCHVDACIGGWVLPYAARLGRPVPPWTLRGRRRHLDLGGPAQVRLRPQGHVAPPAPHAGAAPAAVLRLRRLARLHDAQLDDAVHEVRRAARRRVGGRRVARRRGLPDADPAGLRRGRRDRRRDRGLPVALAGRPPRLVAGHLRDRRQLRRVLDLRRDARARVVRPAADVVRRAAARRSTCRSAPARWPTSTSSWRRSARRWRPRRRPGRSPWTPASRRTSSRSTRPR